MTRFNHYQTERDTADTYEWIHVHGDHIGWIHTDYYTDVEAARPWKKLLRRRGPDIRNWEKLQKTVIYEVA